MSVLGGAASAGITAAGGLVGNIVNAISAKKTQKRQFEYNMQLQQQQQQYETEMWDKANAYNSPVQQMARLSEAGLNPNMVYGQSSSQAAGQASVPQGAGNSVGSLQPVHVDFTAAAMGAAQVATQVQQSRLLQQQQGAAAAQMQKDLAEASLLLAKTPGAQAESERMRVFADKYRNVLELQLQDQAAGIQLKQSQQNYYNWTSQNLQYELEYLKPAQRDMIRQQITESENRIRQKWQELVIQNKQADASIMQGRAALQNANTNAMVGAAQVGSYQADASLKAQQELYEFAKTEEQKIANKFSKAGIDPKASGLAGSVLRSAASLISVTGVSTGLGFFGDW